MGRLIIISLLLMLAVITNGQTVMKKGNYNKLNDLEKRVILNKGTEYPHTGKYVNHKEEGVYVCKQCNLPLYRSGDKFD